MKTNGNCGTSFNVKQFKYTPQPDITIYELAMLLPLFTMAMTGISVMNFIDGLPDEAKRHFKDLTDQEIG